MSIETRRPLQPAPTSGIAMRTSSQQHTHRPLRIGLGALLTLIALTALDGAILVVPTLPRAWLHQGLVAPFADYTIPALALGLLCGGGALAALVAVVARPRLGALAAVVAGVFVIGFELVEILVVGFTAAMTPTQPVAWLQVFYIVVGSAIAALGVRLWKAETGPFRATLPVFWH